MRNHKYYIADGRSSVLTRPWTEWVKRREPVPDFPRHAQVQTVTGCNADCVFCPNRKTALTIPMGRQMDMALFRRIADELIDGGVERISPYLMNEPMLDSELPARVAYVTGRKQPRQYTKINSHGGLLTERMAQALLDSGLDRLNFSVHGIEPEPYERVMHLKLDRVLANIDRFLELKHAGGYKKPRVRISMLVTKVLEPQLPKIREYWGARGIKINLNRIENRGAHQGIEADALAPRQLEAFDWCSRMFEQVYVLYDGRLVLCCADWEQAAVMGDASKQTIGDIWRGRRYTEFRRRFLAGQVTGMLCEHCTKDAVSGYDDDD